MCASPPPGPGRRPWMPPEQLRAIRDRLDYQAIIDHFGLTVDTVRSRGEALFLLTPWTAEKTASLKVDLRAGAWHTFSGEQKGGGPLELVQELLRSQGQFLDIFAVGHWVMEHGLVGASPSIHAPKSSRARSEKEKRGGLRPNAPVRFELAPLLRFDHPALGERGISREAAEYLSLGYLPPGGSSKLRGRLVFPVRSIRKTATGWEAFTVSHVGRALTADQEAAGKYDAYPFRKRLELLGQDLILLDPRARAQTQAQGRIVLVEGMMDLAKLVSAGCLNVLATMGALLHENHLPRLREIAADLGVTSFLVCFDHETAAQEAQNRAVRLLEASGLSAEGFLWGEIFSGLSEAPVASETHPQDPADFSPAALQQLRAAGQI